MSDLLLRTQLELFSRNLERLKKLGDIIKEQRSERIGRLFSCLHGDESINSSIKKIVEVTDRITRSYKDFLDVNECDDELLNNLDADENILTAELNKARNVLRSARKNVERMQDHYVNAHWQLEDFACGDFGAQTERCISSVKAIYKKIEEASVFEKNDEKENAKRAREEAWSEYRENLHEQSQDLFTEYVDFLRGLAMRDEGIDEGICRIVDELISRCRISEVVPFLSIPDRHEAVSMTIARIIRIGFPGWTIWAVPLAVHELGHIAVKGRRLQEFIEGKAAEGKANEDPVYKKLLTDCLEEILSDAVATYLIGPAYACAAILMHFNPTSAYRKNGQTTDAKRVYVILDMLSWMNEQVCEHPYTAIIEKLKEEWNAALGQAKQPLELEPEDKSQLDEWLTKPGALGSGRENIKRIVLQAYSVQSWHNSEVLKDNLLNEENYKLIQIDPTRKGDLIYVLTAAWLSRIDCSLEADIDKKMEKIQKIEEAARFVWDKMSEIGKGYSQKKGVPASPQTRRI